MFYSFNSFKVGNFIIWGMIDSGAIWYQLYGIDGNIKYFDSFDDAAQYAFENT